MFINDEIFIALDDLIKMYERVIPKLDAKYVAQRKPPSKYTKDSIECTYNLIVHLFKHLYYTKTEEDVINISQNY